MRGDLAGDSKSENHLNRKGAENFQPRIDVDKFPAQICVMANRKKFTAAQVEKQIRAIQSRCKQKPGEKSAVQELLEERRAEREKEDRDYPAAQPG